MSRRGLHLVLLGTSLTVVTGIVFAAWLLPRFKDPKRVVNMHFAWIELRNYDATHGSLPGNITSAAGQPLISWRSISADGDAAIRLGDDCSSWDSSANCAAASYPCTIYCFDVHSWSRDQLHTRVLAVTGPDAAFDASQQHSLRDLPSDLIVLVEVWETGIHWLEPRDIDVRQLRQLPLNGPDGTGCLVLFADGTLALLDANTPLDLVHTFCTISGAKSADRGELLGEHIRRVWSSSECVN